MKPIVTEISQEMVRLLHQKFGVPSLSLKKSNWNAPITGSVINLSEMDLVYLFFETEKHFQIRIDQQYLRYYGFCSIDQIARVIEQTLGIEKVVAKNTI